MLIVSDGISEFLLPLLKPFGPSEPTNLKASIPELAKELSKTYAPLKRIYTKCIEMHAVAPAIGSTLEWLKAVGGRNLPTDFEEMELDCESIPLSFPSNQTSGQGEYGANWVI